jgi:alkylation response protein AidB-like acyl-CoA dehydrogenase
MNNGRECCPLIAGDVSDCFAETEPTTYLDATKLKTMSVRQGDRYVVQRPNPDASLWPTNA